jgi:hypothetical protein
MQPVAIIEFSTGNSAAVFGQAQNGRDAPGQGGL